MKIQSVITHILPRRKSVLSFCILAFFIVAMPFPVAADFLGEDTFKKIFVGVLNVEAFFASAAATLFVWILNPDSFSIIMNNPVFYEMWKIVRDTANMIFILVLLFSAFATIYQIDKYKYNKILWTVIIMALLVNFSWPIARVVIDFFNSMMYFFVQSIFSTSGHDAAGDILGTADLSNIFLPNQSNLGELHWDRIFLAIIVMFIFALTLLVLAITMLVRLIALPILAMLSPIGFAGMAAPFTHKYANDWWSKLFKYASYGPISVFMVLASVTILKRTQGDAKNDVIEAASTMSSSTGGMNQDTLASVIYFAIPIVLFWMAIKSAEKMSNEISGLSLQFGTKISKWAGRQPWRATKGVASGVARIAPAGIQGRLRGVKKAWQERSILFSDKEREKRLNDRAELTAGYLSGGRGGQVAAQERIHSRKEEEAKADFKKNGANEDVLRRALAGSNEYRARAAASILSEQKKLTVDDLRVMNSKVASERDLEKKARMSKSLKLAAVSLADNGKLESASDLRLALEAVDNDLDKAAQIIRKTAGSSLEAGAKQYSDILKSKSLDTSIAGLSPAEIDRRTKLVKELESRIIKEGKAQTLINHRTASLADGGLAQSSDVAYRDVVGKMNAETLGKQGSGFHEKADLHAYLNDMMTNSSLSADEKKANRNAYKEAMKNMKGSDRAQWIRAGVTP